MKNYLIMMLAMLVVSINGIIRHFYPPNGIMFTPVVLVITTYLICFWTKDIKTLLVSILCFFFVALNDLSIKFYSGGIHDDEGMGVIHVLLFIGLVPTFGILAASIIKRKEERLITKIIAFLLFVGLIVIHLQLFDDLGLERSY